MTEQPEKRSESPPDPERNLEINVRDLEPGTLINTKEKAVVEVVANPRDGLWVLVRYVKHADDPSKEGEEEMLWVDDVVGFATT